MLSPCSVVVCSNPQPITLYLENLHFLWYLRKQIFFNLSKGKIIKLYNFENPYNVDSALYTAVNMKSYIWLQEKAPPILHLQIKESWFSRHLCFLLFFRCSRLSTLHSDKCFDFSYSSVTKLRLNC